MSTDTAATARRLRAALFVPGDRPDRVAKAVTSGATTIVVDLEDAVAASRKEAARETAAQAVRAVPVDGPLVAVRVNAPGTGLTGDDVRSLVPALDRLDVVLLPMAACAEHVGELSALLHEAERAAGRAPGEIGIVPLIETAAGILDARAVATADPRVVTTVFGPADLAHELGVVPTAAGDELNTARAQLVLATVAAGRPRPIDGPHLDLDDADGLVVSAHNARRLGFAGKLSIHPRQLAAVRAAFAPTAEQMSWARQVDEAFAAAERDGVSSIRLDDGTFVDYPIALRARALLAEAG